MGRAADAIALLTAQVVTLTAQIAALTAEPKEDPADVAAINAVLGDPAAAAASAAATAKAAAASAAATAANTAAGLTVTNGIVTDASGKTVYAFTGTGTPDPSQWPPAGTYTTADGTKEPVFYFAGDHAAGLTTGDGQGGVWAVIKVAAPAASPAPAAGT